MTLGSSQGRDKSDEDYRYRHSDVEHFPFLRTDFDWPTRVIRITLTWCPVDGNLHCARSTTKVIELNSDDRDHGDKPIM